VTTVLGIVFATLKRCGVISWSWWWVTVPFWEPALIGFVILLGVLTAWAVAR